MMNPNRDIRGHVLQEEPKSPNEGVCLRYMMHPKRFEAESLNPKVESGGQVTPKFGCEVTHNGADSHWTSAPTIEAFAIKI